MRPHPDVDLLALHALGEPVLDAGSQSHLATCQTCASTVRELSHTVRTVRGDRHEPLTAERVERARGAGTVPAHVWQGIASELGLDASVRPASIGPSIVPAATGRTPATRVPAPHPGPSRSGDAQRPDDTRQAPDGRRGASPATSSPAPGPGWAGERPTRRPGLRRAAPLLAVAAAGLAVGVAGSAVVAALDPDDAPTDAQVLAAADLEAFGRVAGTSVSGAARLEARPTDVVGVDGQVTRVLQVWLDELPDTGADGFLEAWLIDPDTGAMVSLGPVDTGGGRTVTVDLTVPAGLDVGTYALVDVSAEPLDGDPTHSGDSLLRGTLGA
ncbi:anti-sigma factor [Aquipuribacter sp. MA13-6]|uniref:anti-sigma factor n=1 Tax=unclassified Aquipuribacter TaxID=2635084 RepID=UPI003EE9B8B3